MVWVHDIWYATMLTQSQERTQVPTSVLANHLPAVPSPAREPSAPVQAPNVQPAVNETATQELSTMAISPVTLPSLSPFILTPPPTVVISPPKKRKGPQILFVNYLDDEPKRPWKRSRR